MWNLNFITRENLKQHIKNTISTYEKTLDGIDLSKFNSNIVDPIKMVFDSKVYRKDFEEVIKDYIDSGFVKVIDVRGKTNQQIEKYNEFYHTIANNYDYVAFFDIDEFLYIDAPTIQEFVDSPKFTSFNSIAINSEKIKLLRRLYFGI